MFPITNMKDFSLPSKKNGPVNCYVCNDKTILSSFCSICGNQVCRNKCSYTILNSDIQNKPWLSSYLGGNVCLKCMPRTITADDKYIRKLFAEIFEPETIESDYSDSNTINDTIELQNTIENEPIDEIEQKNKMDFFIGSIMNDLSKHKLLKFDESGKLSTESLRYLSNSFRQYLFNANLPI